MEFNQNYEPTFEVFMDATTRYVSLELRGADGEVVWERQQLRVKGTEDCSQKGFGPVQGYGILAKM